MSIEVEQVDEGTHNDGLFDQGSVATPSDDTMQWRAALLQMVNWGGFSGLTTVPLRGDTTMISGASGVGKSTVLDAYTALMMSSDTKFNGASNDAVGGRARGVGQRNLLSYLRGAVDVVDNPRTGLPEEKLLRGRGVDTWGAVAMTFVNDQGGRFTVLRTYYVPRRATRSGDVQMQLVTHDGPLELDQLELAVGERFHAHTLKKLYPGVRVHRTYGEFAAVLHARLGIGAGGDGAKALRLLARIQAGNQVRSVDELYKDMVLEEPSTYAAADRAIDHFDDLDAAHTAMRTEEAKLELLAPITGLHERLVAAEARQQALDSYGVTAVGDTPLRLWLLRTHLRLIEAAVVRNRQGRQQVGEQLGATLTAEAALSADLETAKEEHRAAGGSTLQSLALSLEQERAVRDARHGRRDALLERMLPIIDLATTGGHATRAAVKDAGDFKALQEKARTWLDGWQGEREQLRAARDEVRDRRFPLQQRQADLRRERASLEARPGRVPAHLHQLREQVAAASGLPVEQLPFVAELIDVAPDETRWRTAVETVLGASARLMLVPLERLEEFSATIDDVRLRGRLTFEGVELDLDDAVPADPERIAGKLVFKESPFSGWVQAHVAEPVRNALCVEDSAGLHGPGNRVTLAGQTRSGRRGAHGRSDSRNIIGFSNVDALDDLDAELTGIEEELLGLDNEVGEIDHRIRVLEHQRTAWEAVVAARYDDIDVAASDARIDEIERRRDDLLGADDRLQVLQGHIDELAGRLEEVKHERFGLKQRQQHLNTDHGDLVDAEDLVKDRIEAMERADLALTTEQEQGLADEFAAAAAPDDPDDLDRFQVHSQRLAERLRDAVGDAEAEVRRTEDELAAIFRLYQARWESPNLGADAVSYPDYARILADIRSTGLAGRRAEWRRRLMEWSGQDLVPLLGAMASSVEEIEDRLEPINTILRRLEFGSATDRLRIRLRRLNPAHVQVFLKDLRALAADQPGDASEADLERRFTDLHRFMQQLRRPTFGPEGPVTTDRDRLLDVRRHVEISAERFDHLTGELRATYRTLGEKSGGESQELVAFIVGSALRFRLGDELRSRPRFAPVFLDEGFVKADSDFAGRAVQAWKGLGFQLIIGVPLDKVTGLEPHMDELLAITKNARTHQSWITPIRDAEAATP